MATVTRTGYAVLEAKGPLTKYEYQLPAELGATEVDIKITHNGVCGSDLSMQVRADK